MVPGLLLFAAACDPLALASLFDSPPAGTSVLTLLDTDDRELEIGDEVAGTLSASDYIGLNDSYLEAWALDGKAGEKVSIDLISDDFDSYLYVVGPGLSELLRDDDSGGACHARLDFTFLESGTYHVVASSSGSRQAGTYLLRVARDPAPRASISCGGIDGMTLTNLSAHGQLRVDEPVFGVLTGSEASIENDRPVQTWNLRGEAGDRLTISLASDDYDSYLYFFGPGMAETMVNDDGGAGLNSEITVTLTESGNYTVGAAALSSGSTGSYTLTVREPLDVADLPTADRQLYVTADAYGALTDTDPVIEGRLAQAWALEARAGQTVTIDLTADDIDSYLHVVGPGLAVVTNDDGGDGLNSRLVVTFPQTATYRVIASSLGGSAGSYQLRVR